MKASSEHGLHTTINDMGSHEYPIFICYLFPLILIHKRIVDSELLYVASFTGNEFSASSSYFSFIFRIWKHTSSSSSSVTFIIQDVPPRKFGMSALMDKVLVSLCVPPGYSVDVFHKIWRACNGFNELAQFFAFSTFFHGWIVLEIRVSFGRKYF